MLILWSIKCYKINPNNKYEIILSKVNTYGGGDLRLRLIAFIYLFTDRKKSEVTEIKVSSSKMK